MKWIVHKFGGSSLGSSEKIKHVASLYKTLQAKDSDSNLAFVLSAMSGVTDQLIKTIYLAAEHDQAYLTLLEQIQNQHIQTCQELVSIPKIQKIFFDLLDKDIKDLKDILRAIWLSKTYSEVNIELISGHGELWSTWLFHLYLESISTKSVRIDARDVLFIQNLNTGPAVDWNKSSQKLLGFIDQEKVGTAPLVITGYIASTNEGIPTTLKRNGSDYSASIFGSLLDAKSIHIWTDVDGVMSADPRLVPDAVVLEEVTYREALELAYFGAKVLHPSTMVPAMQKDIPLWIHNTFRPEIPGTRIHHPSIREKNTLDKHMVKGLASIDSIALINLEGAGMIGVPGISEKLFSALRSAGISIIMISQASSEYSICVAVVKQYADRAQQVVEEAFTREISEGHVQSVKLVPDCCIIAAVGDCMAEHQGVSATFFSALAAAGVNIRMIAQGSSERNISVVIDQANLRRGLQAVHAAFYLSRQTISVGIVGIGLIGKTLLSQLNEQIEILKKDFNIDLRVRALSNSSTMLLQDKILLDDWHEQFKKSKQKNNLEELTLHLQADHIPHSVVIDCTSSQDVAEYYHEWFKRGIHVITPNKKAGSGDWENYSQLKRDLIQGPSTNLLNRNIHYFYETTVGAGLPVISTLRDLIKTGDQILEIQGIFSGTLSYIFNEFGPQKSFSSIVIEAKNKGYTEPDPRDDLSGLDVTRKLIILGREMGLAVHIANVPTQSLIPEELANIPDVQGFLHGLPSYDKKMSELVSRADKNGEVIRYVGSINSQGECQVGLKNFKKDHPFANLNGSENIISFRTRRYNQYPLIIRGPGAGAEVTAGGVFADLLRLADLLGA